MARHHTHDSQEAAGLLLNWRAVAGGSGLATVALPGGQQATLSNATVLDAYRYMQARYDPAAISLIGVFTDGRDQGAPRGIDLATLTAELAATVDPAKPIGLLFFGYGDADIPAMQQMVKAVGGFGGVWKISKPAQIIDAVLQATGATLSFGRATWSPPAARLVRIVAVVTQIRNRSGRSALNLPAVVSARGQDGRRNPSPSETSSNRGPSAVRPSWYDTATPGTPLRV